MSRTRTAEKHEEILEAAAGVFGSRPFHDVAVDDIAAAAGVGKGTIYRYFASKEELYLAAAHAGLQGLRERLAESDPPVPLDEELRRIAGALIGFFSDRRDIYALMVRPEEHLAGAQELIRQEREGVVARVTDALRRAEGRGDVPRHETPLVAELFLGLVRAAIVRRRPGDSTELLARTVVSLFLHGLLGRPQ